MAEPESKGKLVFLFATLKQLRIASTSRVVVVDGYLPAVSIPEKRPGVFVLQMWHALGALKKFGYQSIGTSKGRSLDEARLGRMHRNYDLVIAGGPGAIAAFSEAFGYEEERIAPLGLPRMDHIVKERDRSIENLALFGGRLKVLYAPTLRKGLSDKWLYNNVLELARHDGGVFDLIVSKHPLESADVSTLSKTYPFVRIAAESETIDLLGSVHCVITDYSAVAFEAGLLGKRVFFYVPDIEEYRLSPGLNIDPLELFPLQSSKDAEDLVKGRVTPFLLESEKCASSMEGAHGGCNGLRDDARYMRDDFAGYCDRYFAGVKTGSCGRIAELVESLLQPGDS